MKNISSFYGGAGSTTDMKEFKKFCIDTRKEFRYLVNFPKQQLIKQVTIFLILKTMSITIFI